MSSIKDLIDSLEDELVQISEIISSIEFTAHVLLNEYKFAVAPSIDSAFDEFSESTKRLFILKKAKRKIEKAIKGLNKLV